MFATARTHLYAILIVLALGVVGFTAPAVGHGDKHARFAHDAGKVDGLNARTLRGTFSAGGNKVANEEAISWSAISFGFTLSKAPDPHYIPDDVPAPPQCPGNRREPKAKPGHLCVYEEAAYGAVSEVSICFSNGCPGTSGFGAHVKVQGETANDGFYGARGSWAVKIPN